MSSVFTLHSDMSAKLTKQQLAKAGRTIMRMQQGGFDNDQASKVVQALYLSRSQEHLREAWEVLLAAFREEAELSGGPAYGYDALDGPQFAKLLPLLGEDLPPAHVARLFESMDVDSSGAIEFSEFVRVIRHLNPRRVQRRSLAEHLTGFEELCDGKAHELSHAQFQYDLRAAVPRERRRFAGATHLNMRDAGFSDKQSIAVLRAIFPSDGSTAKQRDHAPRRVGRLRRRCRQYAAAPPPARPSAR